MDPLPEKRDDWRISYKVKFRPEKKGTSCRVIIPPKHPFNTIIREFFSYSHLDILFQQIPTPPERHVLLVATKGGTPVSFEAQFDVRGRRKKEGPPIIEEYLRSGDRMKYLQTEEFIQTGSPIILKLVKTFKEKESSDEKIITRIYDYCSEISGFKPSKRGYSPSTAPSDAISVVKKGKATTLGRARAMIALCRAASIPARLVTGFLLADKKSSKRHYWVEVYEKGKWMPYDPQLKKPKQRGHTYLPLCRGRYRIVDGTGIEGLSAKVSVKKRIPASARALWKKDPMITVLDFRRLPPNLADALSLVLLMPLGGLVTSIFKQMFKLVPFGYFTTTLLALSFVDVQWKMAVTVFIVIILIGLLGRMVINNLHLQKLPRLTLVLIFVSLSLAVTVSLLEFMNIKPSSRGILLPMISLTMMIERFHVNSEEKGYGTAFKKLGATILVASFCLLLFSVDAIQWVLLTYPETEFFIAAGLVWIGGYKQQDVDTGQVESLSTSPPIPEEKSIVSSLK